MDRGGWWTCVFLTMPTLPHEVIGDAYVSDHAWSTLEALTAIGDRMSGQAGERAAADLVEERLRAIGARRIESTAFEVPGWERGASSLTVERPRPRTFDRDHQVIGLPGTPPCDLEAEAVDLGYGLPEDFAAADVEGKLALVSSWVPDDYDRWVHRQEKYAHAVRAGAAGFLFGNHVEGGIPPTGFISFGGDPAAIPGAGLSKETGDRLSRSAAGGAPVRLSIDCRRSRATSRNVEAVLGPDVGTEVVLGAHYDAHDVGEGAGDDGCGVAVLIEVGRLLSRVQDDLGTKVRLVGFGAEEAGMFGSERWAESADLADVRCMLNLDGIGDSRTVRLYPHGFDGIEEAIATACEDLAVPHRVQTGIFAHGDQWPFVRRGVPAAMIGSGDEGRVAHAHTHNDTIDKIDRRDLRDLAVCVANGVLRITEAERSFEAVSPAAIRERMDEATRTSLEQRGRWPGE